ncbi:TPA: autotransporter outer membrane beta-barrel domain-containing protein [Escherichia coli]|nr:autotransporter outer membrane beta-barrel domain-containing protein [Escherichia coli]
MIIRKVNAIIIIVAMYHLAGISVAEASVVNNLLPYQTYRDFAENKGVFTPGAEYIELYDNSGSLLSTLNQAPMPDFSSVDRLLGVATLVDPQYIVSVKHNGSYTSVRFGTSNYTIVDRNNYSARDFHTPRLNKLVTDVVPAEVTSAGTGQGTYKNVNRFPLYNRIGTGTQIYKNGQGYYTLSGAYSYLTGGIVPTPSISDWSFVTNAGNGTLASYGTAGDSGSPLFGWDTILNEWVLVGVLTGYAGNTGNTNWYIVIPTEQITANINADTDKTVTSEAGSGDILWAFNSVTGTGRLVQGDNTWDMHGQKGSNLNYGKNLAFSGGGTIVLENSVTQGAGALTFNDDYVVKPLDDQTWIGGGIIVNDGYVVDWQVNGASGDSLHKLGTGTLKIDGSGINDGSLSTGDGTVILAQRPDHDGNVQAFSSVSIVSGRPTVILSDANQVDPDNIYWGYRGGTLDVNGNDLTFQKLNAFDDGAIITSNGGLARLTLLLNEKTATIYHGNFKNDLSVINNATNNSGDFIVDGGVNINDDFEQNGGKLFFQGHPVPHAVTSQSVANTLKKQGDDSVLTQPVSFTQEDWETRQFSMKSLVLKDTSFYLGRNAQLTTDISTDNSSVTLGSKDVYIDLNDSNEKKVQVIPQQGQSKATKDSDKSIFYGNVSLNNNSTLNINEFFTGGINSTDSTINVSSPSATISEYSTLTRSALTLTDNAQLTSKAGLLSDDNVVLGSGATLSLLNEQSTMPAFYSAAAWDLQGSGSTLNVGYGTMMSGDITADSHATINIGISTNQSIPSGTYYSGDINASGADVSIDQTLWKLNSSSQMQNLVLSNSQLVMTTDGKTSSNITVVDKLSAENNILYVKPTKPINEMSFGNIPLITAKNGVNNTQAFKTVSQQMGFHSMTPDIEVVNTDGATQWRLKGFDVQRNNAVLSESQRFMDIGYRNFLTEVNNLNRRMGDLRDTKGETGAWVLLMNSSGSGRGGLSDSHVHLQVGADKKHHFDGGDLFTGIMMTVTDSKASGESHQGKTRSVGGGLYASTLFDSGLYIDVIGKYVHHRDDYTMQTLGLGKADETAHSWYLGAETGWRYQWKPDVFIEPQVELVYGTLSGNTFNWQYNGMDISMKRKTATPLIGRTGVEFGKTLGGHDWQVTAKAGLSYQFDLRNSGTTTYRDFAGESTMYNGKDGRMLANIGIDTRIKDNTRIGLTVEKSAFGKYNVDNAINANIRYTF